MGIQIIGHRGAGRTLNTPYGDGKPIEHSLDSFRQAKEEGANGVEFDVFRTKDHHLIIYGKDKIGDRAIKEQTLSEIKEHLLDDGGTIPTLDEAMELFRNFPKDFVYNIELKGDTVAEPALETLSPYIDSGDFDWSQFLFSSFDWDKLSLIKGRVPEARVQPTTATVFMFDYESIGVGFSVPEKETYNAEALNALFEYVSRQGCYAIDIPTSDIRPELLNAAERHGVGFCTHPTGPRTEQDVLKLSSTFNNLKDFQERTGLPVILKIDDVKLTQDILEGEIANPSSTQFARLGGAPYIPDLRSDPSCGCE